MLSEIAPKYFDTSETSLHRIGLLGMITDTVSSSIEDQFEVMGRYLEESLVPLASIPEFIYAHAASYDVQDIFATPSRMTIFLGVKESDIIDNMKLVGSHYEFKIDSDLKIYVDEDGIIYSIPYDIIIRTTKYKNEYTHVAAYDVSFNNGAAKIATPYIKLMRMKYLKDSWIFLKVTVYQYERKKTTENIITNNKLNIPYIDKTFDNQLCNFEIFYQAAGSSKLVQLEKKADTDPAVTTPFVYYKMIDDNTIRFSFANDDRYFVPDYNSTLTIHMYETLGKSGNFDSNPREITCSPAPETENEDISYNRNLYMEGFIQSISDGGSDQKTIDEVQAMTRENMITIKSYTTDTDLNLRFLNYGLTNNTKAVFVKQRDDYAGRIYGCFIMMGDGTDIYPTNTLDLRLKTSEVDARHDNLRQFVLKPGRKLVYDSNGTGLRVATPGESTDIEYMNIALGIISLKANNVRFYMNSVDTDVTLEFEYMNPDSTFNFMAGNFHIERNAVSGSDKYIVTLSITRTDGIDSQEINGIVTPLVADKTKIKVLLVFNTSTGHYVEMELVNVDENNLVYDFQTTLETTDMIDNERISIANLLKREDGSTENHLLDLQNQDMQVAVFYQYDDVNTTNSFSDIKAVQGCTLCNTYVPEENGFYFGYPLSLMRSHVVFEEDLDSDDGYSFLIKQLPVVAYNFMQDSSHAKDIFTKVKAQHEYIQDMILQITENFTVCIKFYNTYGKSKLFYLPDNKTLINHVNSSIELRIAFNEGIAPDDYMTQIKAYIKSYVEKINDPYTESGLNEIHVSILVHELHTQFDSQIKYIEFVSINGYDTSVQTIQTLRKIDENSDPTTVPEYLTMSTDDVKITVL
jgi:hypothetical protein